MKKGVICIDFPKVKYADEFEEQLSLFLRSKMAEQLEQLARSREPKGFISALDIRQAAVDAISDIAYQMGEANPIGILRYLYSLIRPFVEPFLEADRDLKQYGPPPEDGGNN